MSGRCAGQLVECPAAPPRAAGAGAAGITRRWAGPLVIGLLWVQLCVALGSSWRHGNYYDYGWYVGPVAAWFFVRRWGQLGRVGQLDWRTAVVLAAVLVPALAVLRAVERVDLRWTAPLWGHALLVVAVLHLLAGRLAGWRFSGSRAPVSLFALTAVPLPTALESRLVGRLTDGVIEVSSLCFNLAGRPVEVLGDRLVSLGEVVEVTEGCSGIRSFQSFVMAGLFFGELMRLRVPGRLVMLAVGVAAALATNVARTMGLAWIRFERGEAAMERAHDWAGLAAFAVAGGLMLAVSAWLARDRRGRRRVVVRRRISDPT